MSILNQATNGRLRLCLMIASLFTLQTVRSQRAKPVLPAAYRTGVYFPLLQGKRIGLFANNTAMIGNTHLVDTLIHSGIRVTKIFGPEHGFRGDADAGEKVGNYTDTKTGIPVISLYGKKNKPSPEDLADVDIMLFDLQDVGVRFYTYISSLQEYIEAALENGKPILILDRPNPNGFYVDGPVLDTAFRSFVGMQPVPVVYGMTLGEYAFMIAGEKWLSAKANARYEYDKHAQNGADTPFHFQVIKCANYTHSSKYVLPVKPSPNLPDMSCVYLYPSTCFFEGTVMSEGRGTDHPFAIFGHPSLPKTLFAFTPRSTPGAKNPKLENKLCYGWNLFKPDQQVLKDVNSTLQIKWLLEAYRLFPDKDNFFTKGFNRLAGNNELMQQVKDGRTESEIRASWEPRLQAFKKIRKKYLLYPDFKE